MTDRMNSPFLAIWDANSSLAMRKKSFWTNKVASQLTGKAMEDFSNSNGSNTSVLIFKRAANSHGASRGDDLSDNRKLTSLVRA